MSRPPLDPQQIPDDASTGDLAAYVGEDVARVIVLRVAALTGVVTVITGLLSESASDELKAACLAIGGLGLVVLLLAQLFGWRVPRTRSTLGSTRGRPEGQPARILVLKSSPLVTVV